MKYIFAVVRETAGAEDIALQFEQIAWQPQTFTIFLRLVGI